MWSALFEYMHLQLGVTTLYAGDYNNCILECSKYFAHIHLPRFPCHTAGHKPCFLLSTFGFCFCHWQTSWTETSMVRTFKMHYTRLAAAAWWTYLAHMLNIVTHYMVDVRSNHTVADFPSTFTPRWPLCAEILPSYTEICWSAGSGSHQPQCISSSPANSTLMSMYSSFIIVCAESNGYIK